MDRPVPPQLCEEGVVTVRPADPWLTHASAQPPAFVPKHISAVHFAPEFNKIPLGSPRASKRQTKHLRCVLTSEVPLSVSMWVDWGRSPAGHGSLSTVLDYGYDWHGSRHRIPVPVRAGREGTARRQENEGKNQVS